MELHRELNCKTSERMAFMKDGDESATKTCVRRKMHSINNAKSPYRKSRGKSKSLSGQFLVDIDELTVNNMAPTGSFDADEDNNRSTTLLRRASSYPFSLPAPTLPSEHDISDILKLDREDSATQAREDDTDLSGQWKKMHIEPTLPISLKFEDVRYKVAVKGLKRLEKEKDILHGVTGSVYPGELLALLGPSGGGKTTLLNLLSGRIKFGSGTITYNDQPYTKSLKKRIGYVTQDDVMFPHLTVKETLMYAALLRLPNTLTQDQKKERATSVISELGLERCQHTIIGGKFVRGVSGGERKRVCIGNEILLNPSLLFLDEPTSGLDSTAALRIVEMLRILAMAGKTVVTTIHQPSSRLFSKFDKLILLGKGSSLYSGKASEAMLYFSSIGCSPLIAMNPAEFLIDLANGNVNDKSFPSEQKNHKLLPYHDQNGGPANGGPSPVDVHEYLVDAYEARAGKLERRNVSNSKPVKVESMVKTRRKFVNQRESTEATWWQQFSILLRRGLKERRHEYLSWMRVTQVISTAFVIALLWCHTNPSSPLQVQDQAGLLFFISVFWGFFPLFTAVFTFPQERAMLNKERSVDMYKLSAYFAARNISDLPLDFILPIIFMVIVYLMVGLRPSFAAFSLTNLTVFLSIVAAQGLGLIIGAIFMDVKKATTLASVIVMTFMLSGGFFIQEVPSFMSWVRYISFNYHSYRLLLKIQYGCSGSDSGSDRGSDICKSEFLRDLRLDEGGMEVGCLVAMITGYRVLAYILLKRMKMRTMA